MSAIIDRRLSRQVNQLLEGGAGAVTSASILATADPAGEGPAPPPPVGIGVVQTWGGISVGAPTEAAIASAADPARPFCPLDGCQACWHGGDADRLLWCDGEGCGVALHSYCADPPLAALPPDGELWFCPVCVDAGKGKAAPAAAAADLARDALARATAEAAHWSVLQELASTVRAHEPCSFTSAADALAGGDWEALATPARLQVVSALVALATTGVGVHATVDEDEDDALSA